MTSTVTNPSVVRTHEPLTPPASVPLGFLAAAAVGLVGFGLAAALAAGSVVASPQLPGVVAAAHLGLLAFLTTAALGALHQFAPVLGRRPLRSVAVARMTLAGWVATAWALPTGFAHGPEWLIPAAGVVGGCTVALMAWNLSGPLSAPGSGVPAAGLRASVTLLVATVGFGVVYAFDRQAGWFPLLGHRVLAHAHLGLLGWLGLTYVAVTEKLGPMFLLSHRPPTRAPAAAVALLAAGVPVLAAGLLTASPTVAAVGAACCAGGLCAHLWSLATIYRHRRRRPELLHAYVATSAVFLVVAGAAAVTAAAAPLDPSGRARAVTAEVAAVVAWLGVAVVGYAHKVVPFVGHSVLRARGVRSSPTGGPLLFSDLYHRGAARLTLASLAAGFTAVVAGTAVASPAAVASGGAALAVAGAVAGVNLGTGPRRVERAARHAAPQQPPTLRSAP